MSCVKRRWVTLHCPLRSCTAILVASASLAMALPIPAGSAVPDREACDKVKRDIRRIESRLRAGYTARQGVRLEERLRELKERRRKVCR